jgi:hypothetical protein
MTYDNYMRELIKEYEHLGLIMQVCGILCSLIRWKKEQAGGPSWLLLH